MVGKRWKVKGGVETAETAAVVQDGVGGARRLRRRRRGVEESGDGGGDDCGCHGE